MHNTERALTVRIARTSETARIPSYGTQGAACFDLYADSINGERKRTPLGPYLVEPGMPVTIGTGLQFEIPPGFCMLLFSRSGHGFKNDVRLANCVGVIDSDYRGEVLFKLVCDDSPEDRLPFLVGIGERIGQGMLAPVIPVAFDVVESLTKTARGAGGFGSTGV